ncbi:MAG: PstS family phosphate ABC transporter substrate-binding protein [Nodosilinea sp.]
MVAQIRQSCLAISLSLLVVGCSSATTSSTQPASTQDTPPQSRENILVDGSSTVFPITSAVAEAYAAGAKTPVEVEVSFSGTGGGFSKFCAGETDISNASRPISSEEIAACDAAGIRFYELPIAFDALTVVVNPQNTWANDITIAELKAMWEPAAQQTVTSWNQIRPEWPDQPLNLFGPGLDSGTYDYFSEVVVEGSTRSDFVASEDDDILARGVASMPSALGYFGLAYYEANQNELKALPVDSGSGPVEPTAANVVQATYHPLARPLFIYVNFEAARANPALREFVEFYLANAPELVKEVGYIPLTEEGYHIAGVNFDQGDTGTAFDGKPQPDLTIGELLRKTKRF